MTSIPNFIARIFGSNRPDKDQSPQAWEQAWAADLIEVFPGNDSLEHFKNFARFSSTCPETLASQTARASRDACSHQTSLTLEVAKAWISEDFEGAWTRATNEQRRNAILAGLVSVCKTRPEIEQLRHYCPDITVEHLSANRGDLFLRLLRRIMPDVLPSDSSSPTIAEPRDVPYDPMENQFSALESEGDCTPAIRASMRHMRMHRTLFISMALNDIFFAFVSGAISRSCSQH